MRCARSPYRAVSRQPCLVCCCGLLLVWLLLGQAPERPRWGLSFTDRRDRTGGGHGAPSKLEYPSLADLTATQDARLNPVCKPSP